MRQPAGQAALLLIVALLAGGGGSQAGIANLLVQLVALALLAINLPHVLTFFAAAPRAAAALIAASLLVPLLQSVPLPPALWQALPGRELVSSSLELVDAQGAWMPFSLNVRRTLVAFFALMPAFAMLVLLWQLPERHLRKALVGVALAGGFVVLLGAQQLALGNRKLVFFAQVYGSSDLQGTFANHNSAGLFLDIALCALVGALPTRRGKPATYLGAAVLGGLLLVGVVLTKSRSSMALLIVPAALFVLQALRIWASAGISRRGIIAALGASVLVLGGLGALALTNERVGASLSRFDDLQDARLAIWTDGLGAAGRYWPLGAGVGAFDEVFQASETLETLSPGRAGRAHNDYLEAVIESGVVGIALVLGWLALLGLVCFKGLRMGGPALAWVGTFALLALQSILDYPLRNQTLLCFAGLMLALALRTLSGNSAQGAKTRLEMGAKPE
ncbi:O-antigen ligase family protein [Novosphingobium sp. YJ-S2-02]|uniref:O-antigen ligase family protein n=1 Tax=Novosphingobium aureum TaxID=2792964 RepID=A0A931MLR5_9SPHN|nr:O-antigen ligase family protein [Novosphingobium aureum]MBH0114337.1 O-antigen ligase family protein [Novosphingobium aureum]